MTMIDSYRYLHLFFGGFTQRWGRAGNGLYDVCDHVYRRYAAADTLVTYFPWYVNPADVAAEIAERNEQCLATYGVPLQIQIVGYSFGGQTAANVCHALEAIPDTPRVTVHRLCLCDAVARCGRLGWLRAANPFSTIVISRHVKRVTAFVQRHARWRFRRPHFFPAGHHLSMECLRPLHIRLKYDLKTGQRWVILKYTIVRRPIEPTELSLEHSEMDSAEEFHTAVLSDAAEMHRGDNDVDNSQIIPFPQVA